MAETSAEKKDVIEIPVGRYLGAVRSNPWVLATFICAGVALVLLGVVMFRGSGVTGNVVSGDVAAQNLLSFIKAQGTGEATLVSTEAQDGLYTIIVNYQGKDIPVFVTLDGRYLVSDPIPIDAAGQVRAAGVAQQQQPSAPSGPVNVTIGDSPIEGKADAPVTIVEFSDYECPFCERFYSDTLQQLRKNYIETGKAKIVFKDFPLSFHPNAHKAAEAARCVRDQKGDSGYFKMHDLLFENQATLSVENYKKWARTLGVNGETFDTCLDSGKHASAIDAEEAYGQSLGVSGTPTFFVNGMSLEGAQPYSAFEQAIEASS